MPVTDDYMSAFNSAGDRVEGSPVSGANTTSMKGFSWDGLFNLVGSIGNNVATIMQPDSVLTPGSGLNQLYLLQQQQEQQRQRSQMNMFIVIGVVILGIFLLKKK